MSLYVETSGSPQNPPIVFLHGGGLSSKMWTPQLQALEAEYYCLAPDLPEQGRSLEIAPFELEDAARRVADVIAERVPAGRAHVVGLSLGGAVGLTLARLNPERITSLMVTGTAAGIGRTLGAVSLASSFLYRLLKPDRLTESAIRQFNIPEQYRDLVYADLMATSTEAFTRHLTEALMKMTLPLDFQGPVLAAVGTRETIPAQQAARKLAVTLPNARGVWVEGVGHVWNLEEPDLFSAVVRAWVSGAPLPERIRPLD